MPTPASVLTPAELTAAIVRNPLTAPPSITVMEAVAQMSGVRAACSASRAADRSLDDLHQEARSSCVLIVEDQQILGILTERDIVRLSAQKQSLDTLVLRDVMTTAVITLRESTFTDLFFAINLLQQHHIRHLPVVDQQEQLVGLLTHESLQYKLTEVLERKVAQLEAEKVELLENRALELERQVQERTATLKAKADREQLIATIATQIRSSLDLQDILDTMVTEVRSLLGCDRACIWKIQPDLSVIVLAEAMADGHLTHQGKQVQDACFDWGKNMSHQQKQIRVVHDIYAIEISLCHRQLLEELQIRAKILVPIFQDNQLWGLLSVVDSHAPHAWQPEEISLLQHLSTQLEIAIQQAITYQQMQTELAERQRAEASLRESESHQRALISALPDLIMRVNREGTYLEFIATTTFKVIGRTGDFIGTKVHDSLPPDLAQRRMDAIHTVLETGAIQFYEQELTVDGKTQTEEVRVVPSKENEVLLLVRDISDRKQAENALRQSEAENRAIIAAIPDLMFRVGADGVYRGYVTTRSMDILPLEIDPIGRHMTDFLAPEVVERQLHYLQRALATGELQVYEQQILFGDRLQNEEVRIIKSGDDEALFMIRDISEAKRVEAERKQAQSALIREVVRSKMLLNTSVDGIVILDEQGNVIETNPSFAKMLGYTLEEAVTLNIFDLDAKWTREELQNGIRELTLNKRTPFETRHRRKDGLTCDVEISANSIDWDGKNVQFWICRDITQRKQAEAALYQLNQELEDRVEQRTIALQQSEALLRQAQQVAHLGSWEFDVITGKFTGSPELFQIFGFSPHEPEPTYEQLTQKYYPGARERHTQLFNRAIEFGEPYATDLQIKRGDGSSIYVFVKGEPIHSAASPVTRVIGIVMDISDRKQTEQALHHALQLKAELAATATAQAQQLEKTLQDLRRTQAQLIQTEKMSSLGQLVAGVAHEINNPVGFIMGNLVHVRDYTQDLLKLITFYQQHYPELNSELQAMILDIDLEFLMNDLPKILVSMEVGTERIRQIVLTLRNFSRLDEAEMKPVNIHDGIDSTLLILQSRLKPNPAHPGIKIVKEYGDLPPVECYAGQLNQVFMNILSNAIDALILPKSENSFKLSSASIIICTQLLEANWVRVSIKDNGTGMTDTVKSRLFDPFFTTKPVGEGTGLGLSISYQIVVEKHGGRLRCWSEPGEGTEFWIEIPIQSKGK